MAVYGPSGHAQPVQLLDLLGRCEALRAWASERNIVLDDGPDSLAVLDHQVEAWRSDPCIGPILGNELGCYLGTVIVKHVRGAAWRVWPNGHPVVRLSSGRDRDVIALAAHQVLSHQGSLSSIYTDAR